MDPDKSCYVRCSKKRIHAIDSNLASSTVNTTSVNPNPVVRDQYQLYMFMELVTGFKIPKSAELVHRSRALQKHAPHDNSVIDNFAMKQPATDNNFKQKDDDASANAGGGFLSYFMGTKSSTSMNPQLNAQPSVLSSPFRNRNSKLNQSTDTDDAANRDEIVRESRDLNDTPALQQIPEIDVVSY
jgi:hypothetical protein